MSCSFGICIMGWFYVGQLSWLKCSRVFCWKHLFLLADVGTHRKYSYVCCCSTLGVVTKLYGKIEKQGDVPTFHSFVVSVSSRVLGHHGEESLGLFQLLHFKWWQLSWRVSMWDPDLGLLFRELLSLEQFLVFEPRSWDFLNIFLFSWPGKSPCPPVKERKALKLQESPCFSAQLGNPLPPAKRGIQKSKASSAGTVLSLPFTETHWAFVECLSSSSQQQCRDIQDSFTLVSAPVAVWSKRNGTYYRVNYCILCNGCCAVCCYG